MHAYLRHDRYLTDPSTMQLGSIRDKLFRLARVDVVAADVIADLKNWGGKLHKLVGVDHRPRPRRLKELGLNELHKHGNKRVHFAFNVVVGDATVLVAWDPVVQPAEASTGPPGDVLSCRTTCREQCENDNVK